MTGDGGTGTAAHSESEEGHKAKLHAGNLMIASLPVSDRRSGDISRLRLGIRLPAAPAMNGASTVEVEVPSGFGDKETSTRFSSLEASRSGDKRHGEPLS